MNTPNIRLCLPGAGLLFLLVAAGVLRGQTTSPANTATATNGPVVELSPFVIAEDAEPGWIATETLAGSRLRTSFKNVASQVEVMTMDFMKDYALNDIQDSLLYSLNVDSPEDRIAGNGEGFGNQGISNFSDIRGLGGGTLSRNFFPTNLPSDGYNITRVTVASGPNSILFGTGSPAGALDVSLSRASITRQAGSAGVQFDTFGSSRYTFDYNWVLKKDVLAARVALLRDDHRTETEPNHDRDDRQYITALYKPFQRTTISAHFEKVHLDLNRVNRFLPFDNVSPWIAAGRPLFDNRPGASYGNLPWYFERAGNGPVMLYGPAAGNVPVAVWRDSVNVRGPEFAPNVSPQNIEADGWTLLDDSIFPDDVNMWGNARTQLANARLYNLSFEQQLARNWHLEAAYAREDLDQTEWEVGISRDLKVDPNRYLPDGVTPNPNAGKMYLEGVPGWQPRADNRENWRVSTSYEFDFAKTFEGRWLRWFGRHRAAGLRSRDEAQNLTQQGLRYRIWPDAQGNDPFFTDDQFSTVGSNGWAAAGNRQLRTRYYFESGNAHIVRPDTLVFNGGPVTVNDENGRPFTIDPKDARFANENGDRLGAGNGASGSFTRFDTVQFSHQGFFWNDRIVTTFGYRKDKAKSRALENTQQDISTGLFPMIDDLDFGDFGPTQSGITRTKGIVVRPLRWVSLFYNESDTFQANIGRYDPYGNEYPGAEGEGEDYGIRLDLFSDRLSIKYNRFENVAGPSRAANTPFNRWRDPIWNVENRIRQLWPDVSTVNLDSGGFRERGRANYWVMSNARSTGDEVTVSATPLRNLSVRLTYASRKAIETDIGDVWFKWIEERLAVWKQLDVPEGGKGVFSTLNGQRVEGIDRNDNGVIDRWNWDTAWYRNNTGSQTVAQYFQDVTLDGPIGAAMVRALDGKANEFDRSERLNLNVGYRFTEGRFKGVNVGGAIRWRAEPVVGYRSTILNGEEIVDLSSPLNGQAETYFDLSVGYRGKMKLFGDRSYRVQLNVRNALDRDSHIPIIRDVGGAPIRIARVDGRRFILSLDVDL